MEHAQRFDRPFPWRLSALAALAFALVGLAVVFVVVGGRIAHIHHAAAHDQAATGSVKSHHVVPSVPLRPRSRVSVLVLNGNGTSGVAGATATQLLGRGYRSATATNATSPDYATSLVLYRRGWEPEAERLARDAGITVVSPLDGSLPAGSGRDQVVLILGAN
ncbi:MAG TPA: LytR C-terminal domain-containing protein [Gaiellaceae bacterium]|nr:LytR C-terminal domain-containing protein [Gaiellaceae bacterium]